MPFSLEEMAANTAFVTLRIGNAEITVEYYPGNVTEQALASAAIFEQGAVTENLSDIMGGFARFNETLASLLKDWDLYEDAAHTRKVEISAARFARLPFDLRMAVLTAIMENFRPEAFAGASASAPAVAAIPNGNRAMSRSAAATRNSSH